MKILALVVISFTLQACTTAISYSEVKNNDTLTINQPITIAAESAQIYLQAGQTITLDKIDFYQPSCKFISWKYLEQLQVIKPDTFIITEVKETFETVLRKSNGHIFAALLADGGVTAVEYFTEMSISSSQQPDIKHLICSHWEDPYDPEHLTLKQIQQALGDLATIR